MLLYDNCVKINIPEEYKDISDYLAAMNYQYMFMAEIGKDYFLIVDLMQPVVEVDLHIEDILAMNDIKGPRIQEIEYSSEIFRKSLNIFIKKHSSKIIPKPIQKATNGLDHVYMVINANISRKDGVLREMTIILGICKHKLADVIISIFVEGEIEEAKQAELKEMISTVEMVDTHVFTQ
ncbi:hypothetical protein NEOKW01_0283 [Nematocida sp. AWRm80]|nr:hypothetical protein NEOKW01_0283 [Nematocida sp. AWRm80]